MTKHPRAAFGVTLEGRLQRPGEAGSALVWFGWRFTDRSILIT